MKHVFISYQSESADFVHVLTHRLKEQNYEIWWDDVISPGEEWRREIDDAIRDCWAVIVVMTPKARDSEYVTYEWSVAIGREKHVIPIILQSTPVHPRLEVHQNLDFTNVKVRPWDRLFKRLEIFYSAKDILIAGEENPNDIQKRESRLLEQGYISRENLVEPLADLLEAEIINIRTLQIFMQHKLILPEDILKIREKAGKI